MINKADSYHLTRGTKLMIEEIVKAETRINRYEICDRLVQSVMEKYPGSALDYQVKRMNIETTGKVLQAIDTYFFKHHRIAS
ncbi:MULTISPECIES: hypothetical protein [unclassified Psychrobacillus]|uniref:hypothetical protein n=1 Tax=unclassified Psychrobacillus TaxID=2636677 RepID=UPI0030F83F07